MGFYSSTAGRLIKEFKEYKARPTAEPQITEKIKYPQITQITQITVLGFDYGAALRNPLCGDNTKHQP